MGEEKDFNPYGEEAHPGCDMTYCKFNFAKRCDTEQWRRDVCPYWPHMKALTEKRERARRETL